MNPEPAEEQLPEILLSHLVEQYKAYITDLGNIGSRQSQTNAWHVSILSALAVFISYIAQANVLQSFGYGAILAAAFVGIVLCVVWFFRAQSYQYLYNAKFSVLAEMERKGLPFHCYAREKELIEPARIRFTNLEKVLSVSLAVPFVILFVFAGRKLVCS
jgi:hypothetical protein